MMAARDLPSLAHLFTVGEKHWKKYCPNKCRRLKKAKILDKELIAAARLTLKAMEDDLNAGFTRDEAWEMERGRYLIVREEPDQDDEPMPIASFQAVIVALTEPDADPDD